MNLRTNGKRSRWSLTTLIGALLLLLVSVSPAFAQVATPIRSVNTLPATCKGGSAVTSSDVVILITGGVGQLEQCVSTNTWKPIPNWAAPGTIGSTTPNTGAFTTLSASVLLSIPPRTFSQIGSCSSAQLGKFTNASDSATQTLGATYAGGGSLFASVACNGVNWIVFVGGLPAPGIFSVTPNSLPFGNQATGVPSAPLSVTLANNSASTVTGISQVISGTNASDFVVLPGSTCGTSLIATASCFYSIQFTASIVGSETATLTVTDSDLSSPQTVSLSGIGFIPTGVVNCTPVALVFPTTNENQSSPSQQVTCNNPTSSTVTVIFSGVNFTSTGTGVGTNYSQTNNCSRLAPGASCFIVVTFTPTTTGTLTDTLNISDNAVSSPQTVSLSGVGQVPATPTPSSITVTPAGGTINTGSNQQYNAVLTMSDSSTQNLLNLDFFNSSNTGVASITQLSGLANGISAGSTTIAVVPAARQTTQGSSNASVSSLTTNAFASPVIPGDTFICAIQTQEAAVTISSVVDTQGDTFTNVSGAHVNSGSIQQWVYYAQPVTGATANTETVTATFSGSAQSPNVKCTDVPGLTGGVDVAAENGSNTTSAGVTLTTTNTTDYIFSAAETLAGSGASGALVQYTPCAIGAPGYANLTCPSLTSTAGNYYAVGLTSQQTTQTWTSLTDSNGDIFTSAAAILQCTTADPGESQWFIAQIKANGSNAVTIHASAAMPTQGVVIELSGLAVSSVLDIAKSQCAPSSTATMITPTGTTTVADVGLGMFFDYAVGGNFTALSPYTFLYGITGFVTGSEYDLSVGAGSHFISMTDSSSTDFWGANGIFLKLSGSVNPLFTGVSGGALKLTSFGTNSIALQTPTFATGAYTPSVTLSPAGSTIFSSVAFEAVSGNTGLTVNNGSGALYTILNMPPPSFYPYPSGPTSIPAGGGPLYNTQIPSVVRSALAGAATNSTYCFNNNCTYSVANAQYTYSDNGSCHENGAAGTAHEGCLAYFQLPPGNSGDDNEPIYPSQLNDPYYSLTGNGGVSVTFQCSNNATFSGSTSDQNLICYDQQQQLMVGIYAAYKGLGFSLGNCPGSSGHSGRISDPCPTTNGSGYVGAEQVGISPSFNANHTWTVTLPGGTYNLGGFWDNAGSSVLSNTVRFTELLAGTIPHAIVINISCVNPNYPANFPGSGPDLLLCPSGGSANEPIINGLYTFDYTNAQLTTICGAIALWKCAYVTAITKYGSYVNVTGGGLESNYGEQLSPTDIAAEGLQAYFTLGVPFSSSPIPALTAQGGWIQTMTGYGAGNEQAGVLVDSNFPRIVNASNTSRDLEGNACNTGLGCYPSGHYILLNSCVARTMALQPGGC